MVRNLIEEKGINLKNTSVGRTAIEKAMADGNLDMIKFLVLNGANHFNTIGLSKASLNGHIEVIKYVLEFNPSTSLKFNIIDDAKQKGHTEIVHLVEESMKYKNLIN